MFELTEEWLWKYYGSTVEGQVGQTKYWLIKYGKDVPPDKYDLWSKYKHLSEYQVNTPDIVDQCLAAIGQKFETELEAHKFVNQLRVPLSKSYEEAIRYIEPKYILELGVGGDSAISTATFLWWAEKVGGVLFSVDHNPLSKTWHRYEKYHGKNWIFRQSDSLVILRAMKGEGMKVDVVFIDTSHSYENTIVELQQAFGISKFVLLDDALFEGNPDDREPGGVKRAIKEWRKKRPDQVCIEFWGGGVVLLCEV